MPSAPKPGSHTWILSVGGVQAALGDRPLSIGRLPECDLHLPGTEVSRHHAYLLPTPSGPMLVDRSQFGTRVNGERLAAPWLLAEGDAVQIGGHVLQVSSVPRARASAPVAGVSRLRQWLTRYGPSELLGTIVTVSAATGVYSLTGSAVAAGFAGTLSEVVVYYGIMILRETIREAYDAGRRGVPYGSAQVIAVMRNILLEFGVAEALDSGLVRPFCLGVGLRVVGGQWGALLGKLVADIVFYGPVLAAYEWRLARGRGARQAAQEERQRRTSTHIVVVD